MAVQRFVNYINGKFFQVVPTISSAGAANAGQLVALDTNGFLNPSLLPAGVAVDSIALPATEVLAAGAYVNVYSVSGAASVRNADGSVAGKEAMGFVSASVAQGAVATVFFSGQVGGFSGLTAGAPQFLSATTPGAATPTPPSAAGNIVQQIGVAVNGTSVEFRPLPSVQLA